MGGVISLQPIKKSARNFACRFGSTFKIGRQTAKLQKGVRLPRLALLRVVKSGIFQDRTGPDRTKGPTLETTCLQDQPGQPNQVDQPGPTNRTPGPVQRSGPTLETSNRVQDLSGPVLVFGLWLVVGPVLSCLFVLSWTRLQVLSRMPPECLQTCLIRSFGPLVRFKGPGDVLETIQVRSCLQDLSRMRLNLSRTSPERLKPYKRIKQPYNR